MWHAKYKPLYIFSGLLVFFICFYNKISFYLEFYCASVGDQPSLFSFSVNVMNGQYYGTNGAYWPPALYSLPVFIQDIW